MKTSDCTMAGRASALIGRVGPPVVRIGRPAVRTLRLALVWIFALALAPVEAAAQGHSDVIASSGTRAGPAVPLAICHGPLSSALVPLAHLEGLYAAEGLELEVLRYPSGFQGLQAMLDGRCAFATAAVPPVVFQSLHRTDFRILAAISSSGDYERIVVRRDRGIVAPEDLRGRRIAVARSTSAHYFLDTYLAAHGLTPADVEEVFLPAQEVGAAVLDGTSDAAAHWEPNVHLLAAALGDRAEVFRFPGLVVSPFLLLVRLDVAAQNPAAVLGVVRALVQAQQVMTQEPDRSDRSLAAYFEMGPDEYLLDRSLHDLQVRLDQSLPFILENGARWEIGLLAPGQRPAMPNYLDLIDAIPLRSVAPAAVTLID